MGLYGDGKPLTSPSFVTGWETPNQRQRRLREINEVLKKSEERKSEAENRRLLANLERQDIRDLRLASPPSPPRGTSTPLDLEEGIDSFFAGQDRFEGWLDTRLKGYEDTFGTTPLFGSQAYDSAERLALEDWRKEQSHIPDDRLSDMEDGMFERSREFRTAQGTRPLPDVESRFDITVAKIKADVGNDEAVDAYVSDLENQAVLALGAEASDQTVREYVYRSIRIQEHLSDVLDEWGFPRGEGIIPPPSAVDEALRREGEENGDFFKDFPDRPGLLEQITGLFSKKFIPTVDPSQGFKPTFGSLDDVHRGGQVFADPVAQGAIATLTAPIITGESLAEGRLPTVREFRDLSEGGPVSAPLRSQLSEDILSEVISPEYVAIALPFASVGVRGLTGAPKLLRIAANLTVGTDVGAARGFPLLRPEKLRPVLQALTKVGRTPAALRSIPTAIRNNPTFQRGLENLRGARASVSRRAGVVPGADDPLRLRRVTKDIAQENPSIADNIPLRQAVEEDLMNGRSMEDIIETGLSPRPTAKVGEAVGEGGELGAFWRGEEGGGFLGRSKAEITEANLFRAFTKGEPVPHGTLQRVARETDLFQPELVEQATGLEMVEALQARRVTTALGTRTPSSLKKAELLEMAEVAGLRVGDKPTRSSLLKTINAAAKREKSIPEAIEARLWEAFSEADIAEVFRLTAEGAVDPGSLVTQLVSGKSADVLNTARRGAFNSSRTLAQREKSLATYLEGIQKQINRSTEGSVRRMSLERDLRTTQWAWETKYGVKPLEVAQEELRESLRILTTEHRGTNAERLAKLPTERSNQITDEINTFLSKFPKLSKTQKDRFGKRLLTEALDSELGGEIYDAGRQLEAMFQVAGIDRKIANEAYGALAILTTKGATPSSSQISAMRKALDPVLGAGATRQLLNARKLTTKAGELVVNSIGLPRALMASADISALGRQAGIIGPRMPIQWVKMAGRSIRAFWQPEYADEVRRSIIDSGVIRLQGGETVDIYQYATKQADLFLASDAGQLGLTFKEEEYMTSFASKWGWHLPRDAKGRFSLNPTQWEKIPFPVPLAQSERAYVTGLDKIRMDFFTNEMKKLVHRGMAGGTTPTLDDFKQLALFTNNATGRGRMWEFLRSSTPILNALFFAPRLVLSRFAILGDVARFTVKGGPMRRVVWETLAADGITLAGGMFMIKTALDAAGLDPSIDWQNPAKKGSDGKWRTNSDFMKVRVGESHIDFLASMGPVQRLMVGLSVAAYQGDGEMAAQLAESFIRSKEAPVPSGIHDVVSGEDFVGGKVEITVDELLTDVIASRSIPLSWQGPVEAVAASRGEIDIDIGDAIADLVTNFPNRDETLTAGTALSAEMVGGGVTSFFNPGEKLRENEDELLQELVAKGQIKPRDGQEITEVDDLDSIQAGVLKEAYGPKEEELAEKQLEQGLWRDSEWAKNKQAEERFHDELRLTGGYTNPDTGKWEALFGPGGAWKYSEIDAQLLTHRIDGSDWRFRDGQNTSAEINVTRALFGREEDDIEDIDNPVDKLIAEYWNIEPIDHLTVGGEYDQEGFQAARDAKEAEISRAVGDPEVVREYFDSFTTRRDTEVQTRARAAKLDQQEFKDTPVYMADLTDTTINNLLDSTRAYLNNVGSRWGLARYIQWLYYQDDQYQTNVWAVAYWVAAGEREQVLNPERTQIVMQNPDTILFYPGLFGELPDTDKQIFFNLHAELLNKDLIARSVEEGELSTQPSTELFQSQALFAQ